MLVDDPALRIKNQQLTKLAEEFVIHRYGDMAIGQVQWFALHQGADVDER